MIRLGLGACMVAIVVAAFCPEPAGADDSPVAMQKLLRFLDHMQTMRASFRQEIIVSGSEAGETAGGKVVLKRPGRFRWDYAEPYERVVVADGKQLWLYEADLEQVTVRPLAAGLGETPAGLLTGERDMLERFEYLSSGSGEGMDWVRLKPKSADSDFDSVTIAFKDDRPVRLELDDRLGQRTRVEFSNIELNRPVSDKAFKFDVPDGVDVIREGEL